MPTGLHPAQWCVGTFPCIGSEVVHARCPSHLRASCRACSDPHSRWLTCFHLCFLKKCELLHARAKGSFIWIVACAENKLAWVSVHRLA